MIRIVFLTLALVAAAFSVHGQPQPAPIKCLDHAWAFEFGPAAKRLDDPEPPRGDRGFDVTSYDIALQVFPDSREILGSVQMGLTVLVDGLSSLVVDLVPDLACHSVSLGDKELTFTRQADSLVVQLPRPFSDQESDTVTIVYGGRPVPHGSFNAGFMFRSHDSGTRDVREDDAPIVATMSEPWSAHSWWPCKDNPADKALVSIGITVPDTLSAVANGRLEEVTSPEPGWRRYQWRHGFPISTYLVSVAVSNYVSWSEDCLPATGPAVPLEFHVFPQDEAKARYDLEPTCGMLDFLTRLVGPYPFPGEKYAQVEFKWIGAMEHTTATSVSQILLTGDRRFEAIVLHELAHHWFGNSLTPRRWADIWLNEGFARYCEALWIEEVHGAEAYVEFMREIGPRRHPDLFRSSGILSDPQPILPNALVYDKGAWVLHMLRQLIGDEAFFRFLHSYATDGTLTRGGVELGDMISAAESAAGRNLEVFFQPWLETEAVPRVTIEQDIFGGQAEGTSLRLDFTQHQSPVFEIAVPVRAHTACGTHDLQAHLNRSRQSFVWHFDCPVDSAVIDPQGMVLWDRGTTPPPPILVQGPWPNPAGSAGSDFAIFLISDGQVTVKVYDARGRKVQNWDLGYLATTGLPQEENSEPHQWRWHSGAGSYREMAAGIYWLEFQTGPHRTVRKVTLLK